MRTKSLEAAFRATTYRVETTEGPFDLRVGVSNPAFDAVLRRQGVSCWGVVTACNPGGIQCDGQNPQSRDRLRERLKASGHLHFPAMNLADDETWPAEPGFMLLQASEIELITLASEFSQLAVVYGVVGSAPRLVWTD